MLPGFSTVFTPIHPAGWPFIGAFAVGAYVLGLIWAPLGVAGLALTAWCVYFFRDPVRTVPVGDSLVVSPADGRISSIARVAPPAELALGDGPRTRISVFLNVFDVHVNRFPVGGKVGTRAYRPGSFLNAALDKASEENERMALRLDLPDGRSVGVVQIAGLVARRIICTATEGQTARTGERFGLIRFGSRVDVYLPEGVNPAVALGQRVLAGETILADLASTAPARGGRPE
jgi:phosphatidylserine decarboxylase